MGLVRVHMDVEECSLMMARHSVKQVLHGLKEKKNALWRLGPSYSLVALLTAEGSSGTTRGIWSAGVRAIFIPKIPTRHISNVLES